MNSNKVNTFSLFLLIAFLNAFSSSAFSLPIESLDLNSRNFDYLQANQNKTAVFFEVANISYSYDQNSSNEFIPSGTFPIIKIFLEASKKHSQKPISWHFIRDNRQLLSQHIFPFQFFW